MLGFEVTFGFVVDPELDVPIRFEDLIGESTPGAQVPIDPVTSTSATGSPEPHPHRGDRTGPTGTRRSFDARIRPAAPGPAGRADLGYPDATGSGIGTSGNADARLAVAGSGRFRNDGP